MPTKVKEVKSKIRGADVILIATPEYNLSVPEALNNAIDWASRPYVSPMASNLPWLNKNTDKIRFVKAIDDNKILIEDIPGTVDQGSKTKTVYTEVL